MPFLTDMYHEQNRHTLQDNGEVTAAPAVTTFDPAAFSRRLNAKILGQEHAVAAVVRALSIAHIGAADSDRPLSSVLLVGPTGVGKTELVRQVAAELRSGPDDLCRIDMNSLAQEHYAASFSGAPPGYAGSKESFTLFDKAKIEGGPYTPGVVLFDEVEKADAAVIRALLQVLDTGLLRLANGKEVISFRNSYIFLTSNIGSDQAAARQRAQRKATLRRWWASRWKGPDIASRRARNLTIQSVEKVFDPEFYNRIDETVVFDAFDADTAELVTRKEIDGLVHKLKRRNVHLEVDTGVVSLLQRVGFDPVYGARGLRRAIRNTLTEAVAHYVISQSASEGPLRVLATLDGDAVRCTALPGH